jgi:hypothetical protein
MFPVKFAIEPKDRVVPAAIELLILLLMVILLPGVIAVMTDAAGTPVPTTV